MTSTAAASEQLQGIDISKVLRSKGPIVSCVVLRAAATADSDENKPSANDNHHETLVEQIKLDTTPKKAEVETVLGGPFTFVGQYHEEGIVLMAKRGNVFAANDDDEEEKKPSEPLNPHKLQPPFEACRVYGDILVLKVAECDDEDDENENPAPSVKTNDEFFLHYTKEEYLKFAARTDVVPPVQPEVDEEEEAEEEEEENDWSGGEDSGDEEEEECSEEEAQSAMMQLLMATCLRKFQEENGRGPSTEELLALKSTIMAKLGIPSPEEEEDGENEKEGEEKPEEKKAAETQKEDEAKEAEQTNKRSADDASAEDVEPMKKKVKFGTEETGEEPIAVPAQ